MSRYCKNCGKELNDTDVKCPDCGIDLKEITEEKEEEKTPLGLAILSLLLFSLPIPVNYMLTRSMDNGNPKVAINVISFMIFLTGASLYKETRRKSKAPFVKSIPVIGLIIIIVFFYFLFAK